MYYYALLINKLYRTLWQHVLSYLRYSQIVPNLVATSVIMLLILTNCTKPGGNMFKILINCTKPGGNMCYHV